MDIYIIYTDDLILEKLRDANISASPFFHFIKEDTVKGKKDALKIKSHLAAKLTPFIAVYENNKPIKAFYSEASSDVLADLINYLNSNYENTNI